MIEVSILLIFVVVYLSAQLTILLFKLQFWLQKSVLINAESY